MSEADPYFLGYRQAEQERLEQQAHQLAAESAWLFDQVGLRDGSSAIEFGCGPRGCLDLLSERVGAAGRVVGVERSAEEVQRARRFVTEQNLGNVELLHADARRTGLPARTFDLATARLVLVNVPEPRQLIAEMARLVRAGGTVALHEADAATQLCDPPNQAWTRILQLLDTYAQLNSIDRTIGRQVPRLLRDAGLVDVRVNPLVHAYPSGHPRRMMPVCFVENVRQRLLDKNLIGEAELNELTEALKRHLDDPGTLVISSIFIQAWGRIPG